MACERASSTGAGWDLPMGREALQVLAVLGLLEARAANFFWLPLDSGLAGVLTRLPSTGAEVDAWAKLIDLRGTSRERRSA